MITNNPCRKLPTNRISSAENIPDTINMRKTNLRKTYILFCVSRLDTQNMMSITFFKAEVGMKNGDVTLRRKLPIIRRSTAENIPDNKSMRKINLRKTYIPFCLSKLDTQNMSVIIIFETFQIYTSAGRAFCLTVNAEAEREWKNQLLQENCRKAVEHLLIAGITFQVIKLVKLENWTIHLIANSLRPIIFYKTEAVMENQKGVFCLNLHFFLLPAAAEKYEYLSKEAKTKIALKYSTFMKNYEGKLNYGT